MTNANATKETKNKRDALNKQLKTGETEIKKSPVKVRKGVDSLEKAAETVKNSKALPGGKMQKRPLSSTCPESLVSIITHMGDKIKESHKEDKLKKQIGFGTPDLVGYAVLNMINSLKENPIFEDDKDAIDACVDYVEKQYDTTEKQSIMDELLS